MKILFLSELVESVNVKPVDRQAQLCLLKKHLCVSGPIGLKSCCSNASCTPNPLLIPSSVSCSVSLLGLRTEKSGETGEGKKTANRIASILDFLFHP